MLYRHSYYIEYEYKLAWYLPSTKGSFLTDVEFRYDSDVLTSRIMDKIRTSVKNHATNTCLNKGNISKAAKIADFLDKDDFKLNRIDLLYSVVAQE